MFRPMPAFVLCAVAMAQAAHADSSAPSGSTHAPPPQAVADARNACAADLQKFCAGVPAGGGRILACLKQHKDEVSDACKQAVIAAMQGAQGAAGAGSSGASPAAEHPAASGGASPAPAPAKPQVDGASPAPAPAAPSGPSDGHVSAAAAGGCFADMAQVSFHAQSADGSIVLEGIPGVSWQYADSPATQRELNQDNQSMARYGKKPCPVKPPVSAADLLRKSMLDRVRPGKAVASVEPLPEFEKLIRARMGLPAEPGSSAGTGGPEPRVNAARARLQYDLDGKPVEEWVTAVTVIYIQGGQMGRGANNYDCHGMMVLALRAPQGRLDDQDKLFKLIASTIRVEPKWQAAVGQFIAQLTQADQRRKAANKKIWDDFYMHAAQVTNGMTANMMAGAETSSYGQSQLIRQVQTFRNPDTGATFELSNQYDHAWQNGTNQYIMSDDPNFNPNGQLDGSWTNLQVVRPQP